MLLEKPLDLVVDARRFKSRLARGFGQVMFFDGLGSDPFLGQKFRRRQEEVQVQPPLRAVEFVHEIFDSRRIRTAVTQVLAHLGPVLLLHMGVVVGFALSGSGETDRFFSFCEVFYGVVIDEFAAVIRVEAQKREREGVFDVFELLQDTVLAFTAHSALFSPSGGNIHRVDRVNEFTRKGAAAMGDGVSLDESGSRLIPLLGFDRDMFLISVPGLAVERPLRPYLILSGLSNRSMVEGEIERSALSTHADSFSG